MILEPGDALVFSGHTAHYTPENVSETRSLNQKIYSGTSHFSQDTSYQSVVPASLTSQTLPTPKRESLVCETSYI